MGAAPRRLGGEDTIGWKSTHALRELEHMPIYPLLSMFFNAVRIRRQRNANEFLIASSIDILMSKSGGCPGDLSTAKRRSWLDQLRATDFLIAAVSQMSLNKFTPVVKQKGRIPWRVGSGKRKARTKVGNPPALMVERGRQHPPRLLNRRRFSRWQQRGMPLSQGRSQPRS